MALTGHDFTNAGNKLKYYKEHWHLSDDGDAFATNSSLLQPVIYKGLRCMLKIAVADEEQRGNLLMLWYGSNCVPRILECDGRALLMERAIGICSLKEMVKCGEDDKATRIICSVIAKLHAQSKPYPTGLVPLPIWFGALKPAVNKYGGIFDKCSAIADQLLNDPIDTVVLHGDIHHGNILDSGTMGWLAIDPKGLTGERGFDFANLFCNPDTETATKPGRLVRQVKIISEDANIEPKRILQWIAAWAGLSAAWSLGDGENAEPAMAVAGIAVNELNII
jgi:streptomycin 6-kinase